MSNLKRTLFVGLGGTGGKTLEILYDKMTDKEKEKAKYLYIDTDGRDTQQARAEGIKTVQISNADKVFEVADSLGDADGVKLWAPLEKQDAEFMASDLHNGASQCRMKSRMCLARYLKNEAAELKSILEDMTRPGLSTEKDALRVVVVSSVAGGTGAGTFIQIALYIRRFFRMLGQSAQIIGILSLPDIYKDSVKNDNERQSLYANAYAAIRELNAMNLATKPAANQQPMNRLQGYGDQISIQIDTLSEGTLFNSKKPEFTFDTTTKPFDLIYFVDKANESGGILKDITDYYKIMADVAYSRLFSPMNAAIASGESNELHVHSAVPTAIYGGAGFAKIVYPYQDILRYIAMHHLSDELDSRWTYFETLWNNECAQHRAISLAQGESWTPDPTRRGIKYREDMDTCLNSDKSPFEFLRKSVYSNGISRVNAYMDAVTGSVVSISSVEDLDNDARSLRKLSKPHSILQNVKVSAEISNLAKQCICTSFAGGNGTEEEKQQEQSSNDFDNITSLHSRIGSTWPSLEKLFHESVKTAAYNLALSIFPTSAAAAELYDIPKNSISLHYGLLSIKHNGKPIDIHPLAARYLLYGLKNRCPETPVDISASLKSIFRERLEEIALAFDENHNDKINYYVSEAVANNQSRLMFASKKRELAADMFALYCKKAQEAIKNLVSDADKLIIQYALSLVAPHLSKLISEYEKFFEAIPFFKDKLANDLYVERSRHEDGGNQLIHVCASPRVKEHFATIPTVKAALESDPHENYACAGAALFKTTWSKVVEENEGKETFAALIEHNAEEGLSDLTAAFDSICEEYKRQLDSQDTILKTDVIGAIRNQILVDLGITEGQLAGTPALQEQYNECFKDILKDLAAKARPMVRYNEQNLCKYFTREAEHSTYDVSKVYCYFGIGTQAKTSLASQYGAPGSTNPLADFAGKMQLDRNTIQVSAKYSNREIFCFSAVHCLQPTQIYHFTEDTNEESYYPHYKERIRSGNRVECPHLDIRWIRRGCMPYISPKLEIEWRTKVMKALIFEALFGTLYFEIPKNSTQKIFLRFENGGIPKHPEWPAKEKIQTRNISRLVEYLADDEEIIEREARALDEQIDSHIALLSNFTGDPGLYKQGMTKDPILRILRSNFIININQDASLSDEDTFNDAFVKDSARTMGGILHVAYLLHKSEEYLGEDKDYGELLLDTVMDILYRYTLNLHGASQTNNSTTLAEEMQDVFSWAMKKFVEEWARSMDTKNGKEPERAETEGSVSVRTVNRLVPIVPGSADKAPDVDIPKHLMRSAEYNWIKANWVAKNRQK